MSEKKDVSVNNLIYGLSKIIDSTMMPLRDHHRRTAVASYHIGRMMNLSQEHLEKLVFAAAVHDIGAFSHAEQDSLARLDFEDRNMHLHARTGYILFDEFDTFHEIAEIIHHHHTYLDQVDHLQLESGIPRESTIIQVADRIAILTEQKDYILDFVPGIIASINQETGKKYFRDVVEAFNRLAFHEYFWFDIKEMSLKTVIERELNINTIPYNNETLLAISRIFRRLIDFRSQFTSTHSSGVSAVASMLAIQMGYADDMVFKFSLAGYIHDLGKLTIPSEILEKKGELSKREYNLIRSHTYYTGIYLNSTDIFDDIGKWASEHHEKLDGSGYPYHLAADELCRESRIMAVADIFTALTEDRPYRKEMTVPQALDIIRSDVAQGKLDGEIFATLEEYVDAIDEYRKEAQRIALAEYQDFISRLN